MRVWPRSTAGQRLAMTFMFSRSSNFGLWPRRVVLLASRERLPRPQTNTASEQLDGASEPVVTRSSVNKRVGNGDVTAGSLTGAPGLNEREIRVPHWGTRIGLIALATFRPSELVFRALLLEPHISSRRER